MDTFLGGLGAPAGFLIVGFLGLTAVLWFLLPFSIFGIKTRLNQQIELLRTLNERLSLLHERLAAQEATPREPHRAPETAESTEDLPQEAPERTPLADEYTPATSSQFDGRWQRPG